MFLMSKMAVHHQEELFNKKIINLVGGIHSALYFENAAIYMAVASVSYADIR